MNLMHILKGEPRWSTIDKDTWNMILGKTGKLPGELSPEIIQIAKEKGIEVKHGVYIGVQGPTFETPAEYRMYRLLGGDAVGMSTVPEVIVARHSGIKVFGISIITDLGGFDVPVEVSHEEVQKAANAAQPKMTEIMREMIRRS
jgi:purine-nucleoside phosphorylase